LYVAVFALCVAAAMRWSCVRSDRRSDEIRSSFDALAAAIEGGGRPLSAAMSRGQWETFFDAARPVGWNEDVLQQVERRRDALAGEWEAAIRAAGGFGDAVRRTPEGELWLRERAALQECVKALRAGDAKSALDAVR